MTPFLGFAGEFFLTIFGKAGTQAIPGKIFSIPYQTALLNRLIDRKP